MRNNHLTVSVCENIPAIQFKVQKPDFIDLCEEKKTRSVCHGQSHNRFFDFASECSLKPQPNLRKNVISVKIL